MKYLEKYPYALVGAGVGAFFAIAIFTLGFWRTLITIALIIGGAYLGHYLYESGFFKKLKK